MILVRNIAQQRELRNISEHSRVVNIAVIFDAADYFNWADENRQMSPSVY